MMKLLSTLLPYFLVVFYSILTGIIAIDDDWHYHGASKPEHLPALLGSNSKRVLHQDPAEPCLSASDGRFTIEAFYTGKDPAGLNVATTALGEKADAPEVYHLNLAADELSTVVTRTGCFRRNSLYRFVLYTKNPTEFADPTLSTPPGSYVSLFVNGRLIARVDEPSVEFEEFYFVGDSVVCYPIGYGRFTFDILFDLWPEEVTWALSRLPSGDPVLSHLNTLKAGEYSDEYSPEFKESPLFVDQCIPEGDYMFGLYDSAGDGIEVPTQYFDTGDGVLGYYEIAGGGTTLWWQPAGVSFSLDTTLFTFVGGDFYLTPTPAPTLHPTEVPVAPTSKGPTDSPIAGPVSFDVDKIENPASFGIPTSSPKPPSKPPICFSGSTTVNVKDRGTTKMRDLKIGSMIEIKKGVFEPVYSFGHFDPNATADLLEIRTNREALPALQISRQHLMFVDSNLGLTTQPAAAVKIGDRLIFYSSDHVDATPVVMESVEVVRIHDGLYAPFTPSGMLLVNGGLLVSSFVALDDSSPKLVVAGIEFSYHWLAHMFEFPHRVICYYFTVQVCPKETYSREGLSTWVAVPFKLSLWLLDLEMLVLKEALLVGLLFLMSIFTFIELALLWNEVLVAIGAILVIRQTLKVVLGAKWQIRRGSLIILHKLHQLTTS